MKVLIDLVISCNLIGICKIVKFSRVISTKIEEFCNLVDFRIVISCNLVKN